MKHPDAAWHDRMYNNRALVPAFAEHLRRWAAESVAARAAPGARLDLSYGDVPDETLDWFPPRPGGALRTAAGAPLLVFLHGGYWRSLDKSDHSFVAPAYTDAGVAVAVPNYALCPGTPRRPVTVPDIALQMVRALAWLWRQAPALGVDPARITVAGHSAGGHLAALLLTCRWPDVAPGLPPRLVRNALSVSGLYELAPLRRTPFLQADLRLTPAQARRASPALLPHPGVRAGRGRLYSVVGGDESGEFLRHNALIRQAWGPRAVPVAEVLPGLNHFSALEALAQPGSRLHALALELLG